MRISRSILVLACCGAAASVAMAGPRDPQPKAAKKQGAKQVRNLQKLAANPVQPVVRNWVKVQRLPDGRIVGAGPVQPYEHPGFHGDAPTVNAWDYFQADALGNPIGGECAGAGAGATTRWFFGPTYQVSHFLNDFVVDAPAVGKPIDRFDHAWNWGAGAARPMWVAVFIDDTYGGCGSPPASSGPVDGVAFDFGLAPGGGGYYIANVGIPGDPNGPAGILAPADGNGTVEIAYGEYNAGTQQFTFDTVPGTQTMLWGKNDPSMVGTSDSNQWDDDDPADGLFGAGECYPYGPYAVACPPDGILQAMIGFWVDPAGGGGGGCYANCDGSTGSPLLTANDFQCFLNKYAGGDTYANCDGSTGNPLLTANDFQCFLNKYAGGCS
jgi:hypothetical protein